MHLEHFEEQSVEYGVSKLNISLNTYAPDGCFEMRTLVECKTAKVFPHATEQDLLKRAAERAVARAPPHVPDAEYDPFLDIGSLDAKLAERMVNYAKNKISEKFISGYYKLVTTSLRGSNATFLAPYAPQCALSLSRTPLPSK